MPWPTLMKHVIHIAAVNARARGSGGSRTGELEGQEAEVMVQARRGAG
jgi:hypothetical protein